MSNTYGTIFIILVILIFVLEVYNCFRIYRRSGWDNVVEEVKYFIDTYKWIFYMMFAIYALIIMSAMKPMIVNWSKTQTVEAIGFGYIFMVKGIPTIWNLFTTIVFCYIVFCGFKPFFKHKKRGNESINEVTWKRSSVMAIILRLLRFGRKW